MADDASQQFTMDTNPVQQPDITPVAQPTTIRFMTPAVADPSAGLMSLARGLSTLDAGLSSFIDQRQQKADQADALRGEADFHKNNAQGYQEGVQSGAIPAQASQAYTDAYKSAQGALAGNDLQLKFNAAYDAWGGKSDPDPNAYGNFVKGFLAQNISTADPAVLKGLMPKVQQLTSQGQAQYIQDRHNLTVAGSVDAHVAVADQGLSAVQQDGVKNGGNINLDAGWNSLMGTRAAYIASGGKSTDIDNKLIDAITSQALLARGQGGPEMLTLLDRNVPGTNYTYAQTSYGAAAKVQTINTLDGWGRRAVAEGKAKQDAADAAALADVSTRAITSLAANPGKPLPDSLIKEGERYDPQFRVNQQKWANTLTEARGSSDPQDILDLNWKIINGGGVAAVVEAMNQGKIKSASELTSAQKLVEDTKAAADIVAPIMQNSSTKLIIDTIKARTDPDNAFANFAPGGMTNEGLGARFTFQKQLQEWAMANPGASEAQQQAAIAVIGKTVLDTIQNGPGKPPVVSGGAPTPFTPNAPVAAPQAPQAQPQQGQPQPSSPAQAPAPAQVDPVKVQAWVGSLPPQQQKQITDWSTRNGVDPSVGAAKFYSLQQAKTQQQQQTGANPQGAAAPPSDAPATAPGPQSSNAPVMPQAADLQKQLADSFQHWKETDPNSPEIMHQLQTSFESALHNSGAYQGNYTVAAIKDNPKAAHILDFISGPESRGNYNAYYGHGGSTYDLSGKTINEILSWQKDRTDAGSPSSATGRYQFIHSTLQGLVAQLGLTGKEKFTPEMQDNLAVQLLKNRGFDQWAAGRMPDATFANNLALEWASLPNVHTGRSQFAGDGLNKSLVSTQQVLNTLDGAKGKAGATTPVQVATNAKAPAPSEPPIEKGSYLDDPRNWTGPGGWSHLTKAQQAEALADYNARNKK